MSLDWTKIYANASKNKNETEENLDKKLKKLFKEAEEIDEKEDKVYWTENEDSTPIHLKTKK